MLSILKNMFRRKTRTVLTISGIAIGIFAFTVMGSMAEKISLLVDGGTKYYGNKVTVAAGGTTMNSLPTPMKLSTEGAIEKVGGVKAVGASVMTMLDSGSAVSFGPPAMAVGIDLSTEKYETFKITYSSGRAVKEDERGVAVVGADLGKKLNAKVGEKITVKGKQFEVVGIMDKTLTAPDNEVWVPLADAQVLMHDSLPAVIKSQTKAQDIVNGFIVYPKDGVNPDELAKKINSDVSDVHATGPKDFEEQIAAATGILNSILFGIAIISLLVGGLSVINTMMMSISERVREIGVKKAVGAKTRNIMTEYLSEAGLMGLLGGVIGWSIGALTVFAISHATSESGNVIFLLTPGLSIFAVAFSAILGVIAGIYPSRYAVKINIVQALREG